MVCAASRTAPAPLLQGPGIRDPAKDTLAPCLPIFSNFFIPRESGFADVANGFCARCCTVDRGLDRREIGFGVMLLGGGWMMHGH